MNMSMSIWQCVIAYDESTMNEYIIDGENWLLTNFTKSINISNYKEIWRKCKNNFRKKYENSCLRFVDVINFTKNYNNWIKLKVSDFIYSIIIELIILIYRKYFIFFK